MNVLSVNNISKKYKNKEILNRVSFKIDEGEVVGLIGPNGAGKSSIMKIISNIVIPDDGEVRICDISVKEDRNKYLSYFSSVIENPSLYENLSGYDNLNFIRKINKKSKKEFQEVLEFIGIKENINNKVKTYSLGIKQRLNLGIALIAEPKLLILDEPTNGFDVSATNELKKLIKFLAQSKKISILISSHILSDLDKVCTRKIFINNGKLVLNNVIEKNKDLQKIILSVEDIKISN